MELNILVVHGLCHPPAGYGTAQTLCPAALDSWPRIKVTPEKVAIKFGDMGREAVALSATVAYN
jgi:hypothetical protein